MRVASRSARFVTCNGRGSSACRGFGGPLPSQPRLRGDDDIVPSSHSELIGLLRDKMDNAVATGLAQKLDEIVAAGSRDEVLGLITEVLAAAVNEKLVEQIIKLVRSAGTDSEDTL